MLPPMRRGDDEFGIAAALLRFRRPRLPARPPRLGRPSSANGNGLLGGALLPRTLASTHLLAGRTGRAARRQYSIEADLEPAMTGIAGEFVRAVESRAQKVTGWRSFCSS